VFTVILVAAAGITIGVDIAHGSDVRAMADWAANQRVMGIRHYTLNEGVTPEEFERFVAEEWNPAMSHRIPGVWVLVMKSERNAEANAYIMVWDIQSADVRQRYWPSPGNSAPG
jgi:hypothetical protein